MKPHTFHITNVTFCSAQTRVQVFALYCCDKFNNSTRVYCHHIEITPWYTYYTFFNIQTDVTLMLHVAELGYNFAKRTWDRQRLPLKIKNYKMEYNAMNGNTHDDDKGEEMTDR